MRKLFSRLRRLFRGDYDQLFARIEALENQIATLTESVIVYKASSTAKPEPPPKPETKRLVIKPRPVVSSKTTKVIGG